jgi:hypothetical protein
VDLRLFVLTSLPNPHRKKGNVFIEIAKSNALPASFPLNLIALLFHPSLCAAKDEKKGWHT